MPVKIWGQPPPSSVTKAGQISETSSVATASCHMGAASSRSPAGRITSKSAMRLGVDLFLILSCSRVRFTHRCLRAGTGILGDLTDGQILAILSASRVGSTAV